MSEDGTALMSAQTDAETSESDPTGSSEHAARTKPQSYAALLNRCWKLIVVVFVIGLHRDVENQILQPYLFSRVVCCESDQPKLQPVVNFGDHTIELQINPEVCQCDLKATYGAAAPVVNGSIAPCAVPFITADSPMWSHSSRCPNYPYVLKMDSK